MECVYWCVVAVILLPYPLATYGLIYRQKTLGVIDNDNPRAQAAELDSFGARIYASQQNAWENAILFIGSVMVNQLAGGDVQQAALPACIFVVMRLCHPITYLMGWSNLRSLVNTTGLACCAWLIMQAALK